MTLLGYIRLHKPESGSVDCCWDCPDKVFDAVITVDCSVSQDGHIDIIDADGLFRRNIATIREWVKKNWAGDWSDTDDIIYQMIQEIHYGIAGYDKKIAEEYTTLQERIKEQKNAELKEKLDAIDKAGEHVRQQINDAFRNKPSYADLEKENAELKQKLEALEGQTPWKDIKDKSEVIGKLTKAKELLTKWVELFKPKGGNIPPTPIQVDTEQFLNSEV